MTHLSIECVKVETVRETAVQNLLAQLGGKMDAKLPYGGIIVFYGFDNIHDSLWHFNTAELCDVT